MLNSYAFFAKSETRTKGRIILPSTLRNDFPENLLLFCYFNGAQHTIALTRLSQIVN